MAPERHRPSMGSHCSPDCSAITPEGETKNERGPQSEAWRKACTQPSLLIDGSGDQKHTFRFSKWETEGTLKASEQPCGLKVETGPQVDKTKGGWSEDGIRSAGNAPLSHMGPELDL